jgi:hypothetical protein
MSRSVASTGDGTLDRRVVKVEPLLPANGDRERDLLLGETSAKTATSLRALELVLGVDEVVAGSAQWHEVCVGIASTAKLLGLTSKPGVLDKVVASNRSY